MKDWLYCEDIFSNPGVHCMSCHEENDYKFMDLHLVDLIDGQRGWVCCNVKKHLENQGLLKSTVDDKIKSH